MNIIVAIDKENGIGKNNGLLTHIPEDLKYFKNTTMNHVVVMGYNTYMSLPKRPLPNRTNIILTTKNIKLEGAIVVNNINELLQLIDELESKGNEVFICGGAKVYESMIDYVDRLYVTHIHHKFEADTFFPKIDLNKWKVISKQEKDIRSVTEYDYNFLIYEKNN